MLCYAVNTWIKCMMICKGAAYLLSNIHHKPDKCLWIEKNKSKTEYSSDGGMQVLKHDSVKEEWKQRWTREQELRKCVRLGAAGGSL